MMQTATDAAAWVANYQAMVERLKLREAAAQTWAGTLEVTGSDPAVRGSGPAKAVPGDAGLEVPGAGGSKTRSTPMTQATVEAAEAKTSIRDAGQADAEKLKEVVEAPPEAGQEATQPESQPAREEPQL
jgi:hypothetical protein